MIYAFHSLALDTLVFDFEIFSRPTKGCEANHYEHKYETLILVTDFSYLYFVKIEIKRTVQKWHSTFIEYLSTTYKSEMKLP